MEEETKTKLNQTIEVLYEVLEKHQEENKEEFEKIKQLKEKRKS